MSVFAHQIYVVADGVTVPAWKSYNISVDMLQPADAFDLDVQFSRDAWDLLAPDTEVTIFIDETKILTGYIGTRTKLSSPGDGTMLNISGRDKTGRLVDTSAPLFTYGGLGIKELAEKIVGIGTSNALFEKVVLTNTRNRSLSRNVRSRRARNVREPLISPLAGTFRPNESRFAFALRRQAGAVSVQRVNRPPRIDPGIFQGRAVKKKVIPGQTRWSVLEEFLREARLLAWSTGDGKELFIGIPNYEQEIQYTFFEKAAEGKRSPFAFGNESNCAITVTENVEEMYAEITAVGAFRGSASDYGRNVRRNRASVFDNPTAQDGVGIHFKRPKRLIITDDGIRSARGALERAEREQLERENSHIEVSISAAGHSQAYSGQVPTIFAIDTMATVIDDDTGLNAPFYVTAVNYSLSVGSGTRTELTLVPKGTLLQL